MTVALVTHESVTQHRSWAIDEMHRVLDKLGDSDAAMLRLDPGFAVDVAESMALSTRGLIVVPAQPSWVPMWEAYTRHHAVRRLENLLQTGLDLAQPRFLAADGEGRVSYQARDEYLAARCDTHVCVYDGRDRGSVVRYLQLVLGIQPTIIIDPATQSTRLLAPKGAPCTSTSPSTSTVLSTS